MSNKRIVNCAITGSIHSPTMSAYLPYKPEDIAQQALDAASAGAASVHIHARDPETGRPSSDVELYDKILSAIRAKNKDVIICVTTGGGLGMTVDQRIVTVPLFKPELSSMNAGSINWDLSAVVSKYPAWKFEWEKPYYEMTSGFIFKNTSDDMKRVLTVMNENGTKPELECYETGHVRNVKVLMDKGLIKGKPYLQFCLGINGAIGSTHGDLLSMKEAADRYIGPGNYEFSAFGAGKAEFPICIGNLLLGGQCRVGLEDNLYLGKGRLAKSNAELVEKMVRIMKELDLEPASPAEAREILGLKK
jgi:uncharacterized protein (DUF849 family)